tara:strand:+ start:4074 stop:4508 length:435 start_codon:yes stop_codon:yes gene_type:complete
MATKARLLSQTFSSTPTGDIRLKGEFADSAAPEAPEIFTGSATIADSAETAINTFDGTTIRAAHYDIICQTSGDSDHQAGQVFVTHTGDSATLTSYGTLLHAAGTLVMYDCSIDGSDQVSLLADPQGHAGLKFSFKRIDTPVTT